MFGRRMQRMARREMRRGMVEPNLRRANELLAQGDYAGAAALFEDLAKRAEGNFPRRAPMFHAQAGHALILNGQTKRGMEYLKRGLNLLSAQGRVRRVQNLGQRMMNELSARGLTTEAQEIAALIHADYPMMDSASEVEVERHPNLPTHCPSCGAAVRVDEVEWLDDITAECDYCGSPVRAG